MANKTPTIRQMRTYLAVLETGSVSAAARRLGLTQPAASQQLQELERLAGVRLLDRAGGRVIPTAAGEAIVPAARRAAVAAEEVMAAAASHRSGEAGRLRLGTGATACIHLLPPVLSAVRRRVPGIEITVVTGNTDEIVRRIEDGALDIGLVTLPAPRSRALEVSRLLDDPFVALVPRGMLPPGREVMRPADLAALPLILYETGGTVRRLVDGWFARAGALPKPGMELGSVEAIKALVGSGLGCSILPELALGADVRGAVRCALRPALARGLGIVLRKEKTLDRGMRAIREELRCVKRARGGP